jgi:hypothetical protein
MDRSDKINVPVLGTYLKRARVSFEPDFMLLK